SPPLLADSRLRQSYSSRGFSGRRLRLIMSDDVSCSFAMRFRQWIIAGGLLLLVLLTIAGLVLTSGSNTPATLTKANSGESASLVDQRPLQTARKLAPLASSTDEQRISQDTLRLADHEVDLAFADALREAQEHPPQLTAESRELSKRVARGQAAIKADQHRIKSLQKQQSSAADASKDRLQQEVDIAQAQLAMDEDELDDAKEDLNRAGGDAQGKIQRLLDEHEATQHAAPSGNVSVPVVNYNAGNLAPQLGAYLSLRAMRRELEQAREEASLPPRSLPPNTRLWNSTFRRKTHREPLSRRRLQ